MRGGVSARVGAVAVAGVLAAVVWIGISGRTAPTVPTSERPGVAQATTASPSPTTEETATPPPIASPTPPPDAPLIDTSLAADDFSVVATIGGRQFLTTLEPTGRGHLSGELHVPLPVQAASGTLEFAQVWRTVSHDAWATFATWNLVLESLSAAGGSQQIVLDTSVPARPTLRDVPLPIVRGYQVTVRSQTLETLGVLRVDIQLGPNWQLVGDDGIFGWPVVGQLHRDTIPRGRGLYNQCRWDVSPMSGAPRSGDEAGC